MGNLCSKQTLHLSSHNFQYSSTSCSFSSIEFDHNFELHYSPATGEGESLKVLFAFLGVPFREVIQSDSQFEETILYSNNTVQVGTFQSLKHLSQVFEIYPAAIKDARASDLLCEIVFVSWRLAKDAFYRNDKSAINKFYYTQLPTFLTIFEKYIPSPNSQGIFGNSFGVCDALVLTFVYNLFFINHNFRSVLTQNAPKLEQYCLGLLESYKALAMYFKSRSFHLYI